MVNEKDVAQREEAPQSPPPARQRRLDRWLAILLFVGLSSLYFATTSGITSSNDGSHYALVRTIVENGEFALRRFDDYAEGNDIAVVDNRLYSDRPPGNGLTATLFYTLGGLLPEPPARLPSRHDAQNPRLPYVMLLPVWAGAGTVVLLYLFMRRLELGIASALTASLMFALGTVHWKYSTVLFSHALSSLLVIAIVLLALHVTRRAPAHWAKYLLLGLLCGYSVLVEYTNGLLVIVIGLYLLFYGRLWSRQQVVTGLGAFVAGGLGPALFLAFYNTANFGGPFTLSYAYAINYPWAGRFGSVFDFPLLPGLRAMLVWGEGGGWCDGTCYNQGLFLLSPVMLLALPGLWLYGRRRPRPFWLTTTVFLVYLLLLSQHHTAHGFTADGRYLTPFLGLLAIPLGFSLAWIRTQTARPARQALAYLLLYGLFFLSLRNVLLHIGFSYNYALDLSQLNQMIAAPQNWAYLSAQIFRNAGNLPLLWLLEALLLLTWGGWQWLHARFV